MASLCWGKLKLGQAQYGSDKQHPDLRGLTGLLRDRISFNTAYLMSTKLLPETSEVLTALRSGVSLQKP